MPASNKRLYFTIQNLQNDSVRLNILKLIMKNGSISWLKTVIHLVENTTMIL
jgi:hypothetical protein